MRRWEDEMMGSRVNKIMTKRDNERMGGRENGKMRSNFKKPKWGHPILYFSYFTVESLPLLSRYI